MVPATGIWHLSVLCSSSDKKALILGKDHYLWHKRDKFQIKRIDSCILLESILKQSLSLILGRYSILFYRPLRRLPSANTTKAISNQVSGGNNNAPTIPCDINKPTTAITTAMIKVMVFGADNFKFIIYTSCKLNYTLSRGIIIPYIQTVLTLFIYGIRIFDLFRFWICKSDSDICDSTRKMTDRWSIRIGFHWEIVLFLAKFIIYWDIQSVW